MTKYLRPEPFSVGPSDPKLSSSGWETTFGKGHDKCPQCGSGNTRISALDRNGRTCCSCLHDWKIDPTKETP